ncbi:3-deoxy-D-arabino-heptulosonate 7-phosphate synthetase [Coccomyxa subellipsoidea C-169]|uniref:Phospho-2-dehydro-3-deoxyheptonate aldolase n=1 Tax=Coccomyxa subellipsoidea (strain C-169) TaxID=574566 RepID=I0YZM0_COCSC|nr:3-deoxy-D-arabino-heptulosonate 7-phosphate synthetase [Coccomyxa subellipsoidea C-169]EIE23839.1 3-deoxy-D-arabino-heptulosonate 7-phosphate synthetase [Coccomyxa subellipsoidea C-169]|eukprot:XP_005648383.1 3-deoxy-D-arabino-heptulosonate 7-phosphate synthetase [Coccomyxa subellipsoidea C-169]
MLVAETPLAGSVLPQGATRLVCKSACRRSRSRRQQTRGFLRQQSHLSAWAPESWRQLKAQQQPNYQDEKKLREAVETISRMPPLVFAGECRNLQARLAKCATGEAFLVQGGDCAESFSQFSANRIRDSFRVQLQMAVVAMFGGGVPVVKVGRMAGQFAKPRSADTEILDGRELPSYRGDIINGQEFTLDARVPDPMRLVQAYNQAAATLNLLRGFATGGYAGLQRVMEWNLDFMGKSDEGRAYLDVAKRVDEAIQFMVACGLDSHTAIMTETEYYVSHECLLLDYEQALTREDSTTGLWYDCSGHMLWCGERTRQLDGAHVEFMRGIANPIGVKVSDKMDPGQLVSLIAALNPQNTPGRLTVIIRMGADKVRANLPRLVEAVRNSGQVVTWVCDPMHGNTECVAGYKTRRYERIRAEVEAFFDVHEELGTVPGGIHLEMTGDNVTECLGGGSSILETDLNSRYHTHCDPRLNAEQALEMSFYVASRLAQRKEKMGLGSKPTTILR